MNNTLYSNHKEIKDNINIKSYHSTRSENRRLFAAGQLAKGRDLVDGIPENVYPLDYHKIISGLTRFLAYIFGLKKTRVVELFVNYNRRCVHPITRQEIRAAVDQGIRTGSPIKGNIR
jgi:hypothetical protein